MEQMKRARRSHLLLGMGVGALLAWAWTRAASRRATASGTARSWPRDAAQASLGRNRAEGASMGQRNFRPEHRERLYDPAGQQGTGPAAEPGSERGELSPRGREAAPQGLPPSDFRHGGLGVRGHVPEVPSVGTPDTSSPGGSPALSRGAGADDFGGGFQTWGHVPQAPQDARHGVGQPDEDFDPDYLQWREEQLRQLDEDYRAWRRHKFAEDFSQWRARSPGRTR
jgi:hypothetical protein